MLRMDTDSRHSRNCFGQTSMGLTTRIIAGVVVVLGLVPVAVGDDLAPEESPALEAARHSRWLEYRNSVRSDTNLVVYYDFEEGQEGKLENKAVPGDADYRASDLDGKLECNLSWDPTTPGRWKGKGALRFNGVCDYVDCGKVAPLDFGAHDWTILFWIKAGVTERNNPFFCKTRPFTWARPGKMMYLHPAGELELHQSGVATIKSSEKFNDGIWHQVGASFIDATDQATLIADGKEIKTGPFPATADDPDHRVFIGGMQESLLFSGTIDEVAIYNRVLTADEIRNHYEMGKTSPTELAEAAFAELRKLLADLEALQRKQTESGGGEELKPRLDEYREKLAGLKSQCEGKLDTATWTRLDGELQALIEQLRNTVVEESLAALLNKI